MPLTKRYSQLTIFALPLLIMVISSCRQTGCDEKVPVIGLIGFKKIYHPASGQPQDSARLEISFKDCDGDIGLDDKDTISPYDTSSRNYYNIWLDYFELRKGVWFERKLNPSFSYRVPSLETSKKNSILEGEIHVSITPYYYDKGSKYDTIKFQVRLIDRALNISNTIETPPIKAGK